MMASGVVITNPVALAGLTDRIVTVQVYKSNAEQRASNNGLVDEDEPVYDRGCPGNCRNHWDLGRKCDAEAQKKHKQHSQHPGEKLEDRTYIETNFGCALRYPGVRHTCRADSCDQLTAVPGMSSTIVTFRP